MSMLDDKADTTAEGGAVDATPARQEKPYPPHLLKEQPPYKPGVSRVAVDRYFKQEYHDLEVERIWKKTWQMACRVEELPDVGDYHVYEVADLSFIVVRTGPDEIKAYWNACLHRARKLCDFDGKRAEEFRCMFHGWSWDIHGKMNDMTCGWDFPGTRDEVSSLPEARVGTWGGWVFINPDLECESLESFLGELPEHFEGAGHDFRDRWKQVHICADLPANWKIVAEAFLEAWHVTFTHPQMVRSPDHKDTRGLRWDAFGNWIRSAPALPTDKYKTLGGWGVVGEDEQQVVDQHYDQPISDRKILVPEGGKATEVIPENWKKYLQSVIGDAVDDYHAVHLGGGEMVSVFPNFHPWAGFSRLVYRFRPHKHDPERCYMDVELMAPWPKDKPKPPPAPVHFLGPDQHIMDAPELGQLARVFSQDLANIPSVQQGLKASRTGYVILSSLNEAPVRFFHDLYDKWMGFEDGDYLAEKRTK